MNQLEDPEIIEALYEASRAGVKIELIVRGLLLPAAGRAGLQREHPRALGDRPLPRALAHFLFRNWPRRTRSRASSTSARRTGCTGICRAVSRSCTPVRARGATREAVGDPRHLSARPASSLDPQSGWQLLPVTLGGILARSLKRSGHMQPLCSLHGADPICWHTEEKDYVWRTCHGNGLVQLGETNFLV